MDAYMFHRQNDYAPDSAFHSLIRRFIRKIRQLTKKGSRLTPRPLEMFGGGGRIRTYDLWVMSPTSYRTAPPRNATYV